MTSYQQHIQKAKKYQQANEFLPAIENLELAHQYLVTNDMQTSNEFLSTTKFLAELYEYAYRFKQAIAGWRQYLACLAAFGGEETLDFQLITSRIKTLEQALTAFKKGDLTAIDKITKSGFYHTPDNKDIDRILSSAKGVWVIDEDNTSKNITTHLDELKDILYTTKEPYPWRNGIDLHFIFYGHEYEPIGEMTFTVFEAISLSPFWQGRRYLKDGKPLQEWVKRYFYDKT